MSKSEQVSWQEYELTTAHIVAAKDGDPADVNPALLSFLRTADDLCQRAGGRLHSRQAIAVLVVVFTMQYPGLPVSMSRG